MDKARDCVQILCDLAKSRNADPRPSQPLDSRMGVLKQPLSGNLPVRDCLAVMSYSPFGLTKKFSCGGGFAENRPTNHETSIKLQLPAVNCNSFLCNYLINLLYSECIPIQNQTKPSSTSTATVRYLMPTLADQYLPTFFKCKDGCLESLFSSLKFSSASSWTFRGSFR